MGTDPAATDPAGTEPLADAAPAPQRQKEPGMLPERRRRAAPESALVRLVATAGVVAIGVALGAILVSQDVAGWITGLVVALVSVALSAILWSSRRL